MTFPDARWGSETSWLRGPAIAFSSTRAGSWLIRALTPVDRWINRSRTDRPIRVFRLRATH